MSLDVTPYRELKIAPRAVFDSLEERADQPRFMVRRDSAWAPVSWGRFAERILDYGSHLLERGVEPGDRVAIHAPNSVDWAAAALGIQAVGGVVVPIYGATTAEQAAWVVEHSDARVVFDPALLAAVPPSGAAAGEAVMATMERVSLDDLGMLLYTSGTSGRPKGVPLTHRNVGANARDWLDCNAPGLHRDAVDLLWLPLSHIFGFGELCLGNTLGFTSWMSSPARILDDLREVRPTVFMSVPSVWEKIALHESLDEATGGRLRFCLSGGAGLKVAVKERFYEHGVLIIEGYGLTEAAPTLTLNRPGDFRFDSVGKPLPSVELRLADDGEILARGPNVFGGYHEDPDATAQAFTDDGWLKTGDVGRWTEDGFLQIVDRKKDILVTAGGKNVAPANIELRFRDDSLIEHLVVYGDGRRYLVAGVWLRPTAPAPGGPEVEAAVQASIDAVNGTLARFETIKRFAILEPALTVEAGFLTPTLKVKRKRVREVFGPRLEELYSTGRVDP